MEGEAVLDRPFEWP